MKDLITIESLFEQDKELAYWQLRQRAETAGMNHTDFILEFNRAIIADVVFVEADSNVKLMGDIEPPKPQFKSEFKEGVKTPNNLCAAVKLDMQMLFQNVAVSTDSIEVWQKRLKDSIEYQAELFPKCRKPHVTRWHNHKNTQFVNAYASETAYVRGAAFLTISCELLVED